MRGVASYIQEPQGQRYRRPGANLEASDSGCNISAEKTVLVSAEHIGGHSAIGPSGSGLFRNAIQGVVGSEFAQHQTFTRRTER